MADSLKQIRLLPEYYGDQALLSKDFWTPVVNASSQIKIVIRSFSQNAFLKILNTIRAQKHNNHRHRFNCPGMIVCKVLGVRSKPPRSECSHKNT